MKVVIMRGGPGFGKSTYIKTKILTPEVVAAGAVIASADLYYTDDDGNYNFIMDEIAKAHSYCWDVFEDAIHRKVALIVVDNTNVKVRDFRRYVDAAKAAGYLVEIVRLECSVETATKRGIHGVPLPVVARMAESLRTSKLPDDWTEIVVNTDEKAAA